MPQNQVPNIFMHRSAKIWNNYPTKLNILFIDFDMSVNNVKNKSKCMPLSIQCTRVKTEWNNKTPVSIELTLS